MSTKEVVVHYFTNVAPHYRQPLWELMAKDEEIDFRFYFGKSQNGSIKEMSFDDSVWKKRPDKINELKNRRVFGTIIWQYGVLSHVLSSKVQIALFLGDMNIISTWIASIIMWLKGAKIYFWGHGLYGNEAGYKKYLRKLFNKLAHQHFIYGRRAKKLMVKEGFSDSEVHVIYNSLDYKLHKKLRKNVKRDKQKLPFTNPELPTLVFIGRLTPVKKLGILIQAAHRLNKKSHSFNLLIIGDGPMRKKLETKAKNLLKKGSFTFYGACYNEKEIAHLLINSDLCVSPGNVGLTAIHSLSFGTPVCTHDSFMNQMPEFEVIKSNRTGFFFKEDDISDLTQKIEGWFSQMSLEDRHDIRKYCYFVIDEYYNPYNQMSIFKRVLINS